MTIFSLSLGNHAYTGHFYLSGGNATESITDYTKNDLLLGSQDPFFWFLIPLFGLVGAGACVAVNYVTLGVVHVLGLVYSLVASALSLLKASHQRYGLHCCIPRALANS